MTDNRPESTERNFPEARYPHLQLTRKIIGGAFTVHREFGYGFLESVYRRALFAELKFLKLPVETERSFQLEHRGEDVGLYRTDLLVASKVVVEVKTGLVIDPAGPPQLLNYLKASKLEVGLLISFGLSVEIRRLVLSEALQGIMTSPI